MFSEFYDEEKLSSILIPREAWTPFPTIKDREAWNNLPTTIQKVYLDRGGSALGYEYPNLPATRFLDFARNGDRDRYQRLSFARRKTLADLVIAECIEDKNCFLDDIANGIWAICEESFWGVPAHIGAQKAGRGLPDVTEPIVDLFAAETSALLAWTFYLLGDKLDLVSPLIRKRIELEIDRRILTPLFDRTNFGWMGFNNPSRRVNNWNPWICSNWLTSTLLIEKDEDRRIGSVAKAIKTLDNFVKPYPIDGGCDEGPSYWGRAGASLYDCLELLFSATNGEIDFYDHSLIQNIAKFIYRVQIDDRYFINFADAPAILTPSAGVVHGFGKRIGDDQMIALGRWSAHRSDLANKGLGDSIGRQLPTLFDLDEILTGDSDPPLPRDVWLDQIEVMVARDHDESSDGFFVGAKGGHNAESHNHNDIGNFVVHIDGDPLLIDAGVETYTAKTFSSRRYEIWTMQSAFHNLPTINGVQQNPGSNFASKNANYRSDENSAEISLDISTAYPSSANVESWIRTIRLDRGEKISITENYRLREVNGETMIHFLTPCAVSIADGIIDLSAREMINDRKTASAKITFPIDKLAAEIETVEVEDRRLKGIWGDRLTRINLKIDDRETEGSLEFQITK